MGTLPGLLEKKTLGINNLSENRFWCFLRFFQILKKQRLSPRFLLKFDNINYEQAQQGHFFFQVFFLLLLVIPSDI